MSKPKTVFICQNCGSQSLKWVGKCSTCNEWNSFVEELIQKPTNLSNNKFNFEKAVPKLISDVETSNKPRINLNNNELNRVLGNGLVPGSVILIGGEPGIGKSTLMLQVALNLKNLKVLYVTGEESEEQIKMRADRIGIKNEQCYILNETITDNIINHISEINPSIIIIDSIQTLSVMSIPSAPGTITQVRECTAELQKIAKFTSIPLFLVGHITKDGTLAGPKILEHMVDTVLQFEGDRNHTYRILRAIKNRFGPTSELGIYEMREKGLREVSDPSELLITERDQNISGSAIATTMEGNRPILIEAQALVSPANYGNPQRSSTGFDIRRLNMLLAVLEKRSGFKMGIKDVFLNITGGIRVDDTAMDLAVVAAILSSYDDIPIARDLCFSAELGLSGEIRPVNRIEQRISEAEKTGYKQIFISKYNIKGLQTNK
ncbi:MAG: DNA repair protein RadA, partial [Bacteroidales bacterium]|nr:DNA repair protein RadA [Bacteroidales bacterium]